MITAGESDRRDGVSQSDPTGCGSRFARCSGTSHEESSGRPGRSNDAFSITNYIIRAGYLHL